MLSVIDFEGIAKRVITYLTGGDRSKIRGRPVRLVFSGISAILILFLCNLALGANSSAPKYSAVVVDANTRAILFSENEGKRLHPAGLTKLMTLYVAFQALEDGEIGLDDKVIISNHAAAEAPVKLGLRGGQKARLRYLIRAAGVEGSNDAATAIAEHIEGSEAAFARRMNRTAEALGMIRSTFRNAHGLTEAGQLSTARDIAVLLLALNEEFPDYFNLFGRISTSAGSKTVRHSGRRLLSSDDSILGAKTGYTRASGFGGVTLTQTGSKKIITVVFGGRSTTTRNAQMRKLRDLGFKKASAEIKQ